MMHLRNWRLVVIVLVAVAALLFVALPADAQCAMCRASLTGSNNTKFIRNLDIGILVLLIPPVSMFCSIFVILRKYRGTDG